MNLNLNDLAKQHAKSRWPKKRRNADLRRHGYDPDGEDGAKYRRLFDAARFGEFAAGVVDEEADDFGEPSAIALWDIAKEDWSKSLAELYGDPAWTWAGYQAQLHATIAAVEAAGHRVHVIRASVAEVWSKLEELGLANTTENRAAAIAKISIERRKRDG